MKKWVTLEKKVGQTPLETAEKFKADNPEYADVKMAYAGRLDPMASGKLLVLIDEECKQQDKYHALDKEYEVEVLLGIESDSSDVLGLVKKSTAYKASESELSKVIKSFTGPFTPPYPVFSSKPVNGKPLHTWALENRLDEIEIPLQSGFIYKISVDKINNISGKNLHELALSKINSVAEVTDERKALGQDFRRVPIRECWSKFLSENSQEKFTIVNIKCVCSSGTYMRSLSEEIGKKLNSGGLALSIHRTKIGKYYPLPLNFGYWSKKY